MPDWVWLVFVFAFGCCVGSFLNVVIYRLPRDKSLIRPGSSCPACGRPIRFYDNVPLVSWLVLGGRCRYCKGRISPRYFVIELLTGAVFAGLFFIYFLTGLRPSVVGSFEGGGWFVYLLHVILLACLIAASAIDLELWVIPISVCWFATAAALVGCAIGPLVIEPNRIQQEAVLPSATAATGSLAAGALLGLVISLLLLATGVFKRSYESEGSNGTGENPAKGSGGADDNTGGGGEEPAEADVNHRQEILKEVVFLLPIVICSAGACVLCTETALYDWWVDFSQRPVIAGVLGSVWGYFVGCGVVWGTRILGTLGFGREAMGLGDVHLMGAGGAMIGPLCIVAAFFVAPFFGLAWAGYQMLFRRTRQIPYGPFLSLGILTVMILHDRIFAYWNFVRFH